MILAMEGPRGSGKTYLIDQFFKQNEDSRIVRYRFNFPGWVKTLGMDKDDTRADLHYMSLGNNLTVMEEMGYDPGVLYIVDRGIFSCYVWSQLRKRIPFNVAVAEIRAIMQSESYRNYHTLYVKPIRPEGRDERRKDMWDNLHSQSEEERMFKEFFEETIVEHYSMEKNCDWKELQNYFEHTTLSNFIGHVYDIADAELRS